MNDIAINVIDSKRKAQAFYPEKLVEDMRKAGISEALAREVAYAINHKLYPDVTANTLRGWVEQALEERSREAAALYRMYEQTKHRPTAKPAYRHREKPSPRKAKKSTGRSKKGRR
jgi:2-phosphoglycerate kinase